MAFTAKQQLDTINNVIFDSSRFMQRDFSELAQLQGSKKGVQEDFSRKCYNRLKNKITNALTEIRPKYGVILDEQVIVDGSECFYIIQPISGLSNFSRAIPFFSVAIALVDSEKSPIAISLHNPILRETFHSAKGVGSWFENYAETLAPKSRMRVSNQLNFEEALATSSIKDLPQNLSLGDHLLELAYVAAGRLDFSIGNNPNLLVKAMFLMVQEAGGLLFESDSSYLVSNNNLHKRASELLK